jgi:2-phosphosulfolactate phosphatase
MDFDQRESAVRCEWGRRGLAELAPIADVVIVVDVLSFSTAVDVATARGAVVYPYPLWNSSAAAYADSVGARLVASKREAVFSFSPSSLENIPPDYRLVLPSPNGAALCFEADHPRVLTACLRNASAVAEAAAGLGSTFAVIPAGETWPSGELRPALEDLLGAGSIIRCLPGRRSPEADAAVAAFQHFRGDLRTALRECQSGRELIERGFGADVDLASEHDASVNVPMRVDGAFRSN